jgi:hypothetical protein
MIVTISIVIIPLVYLLDISNSNVPECILVEARLLLIIMLKYAVADTPTVSIITTIVMK